MRSVLADLALDAEGALALGLWIARAFDTEAPLARPGVALAKYLSNKLAPGVIYEAMEALGGMGYTDDTPLPLLFRESPLNSIWEGSGNVVCLDLLRTLDCDGAGRAALDAELDAARGASRAYDTALTGHRDRWPALPTEAEARWFTESAATLLTASLLLRRGPAVVAKAYAATRLGEPRGRTAGASSPIDSEAILARWR